MGLFVTWVFLLTSLLLAEGRSLSLLQLPQGPAGESRALLS